MLDFVHLHIHSEYSLLDGACRIKELVLRIKQLGQTAAAITDHGNMFGAVEFYDACLKEGIKPIIGCEVYVAPRGRLDKTAPIDNNPFHLILLCENNEGYRNLIKLVSKSYTEGFYVKPRVDKQLLKKYSKGLIGLSACLSGEIPKKLAEDDYQGAKSIALEYLDIFGEGNFFIEIQNHKFLEQQRLNYKLVAISNETGIPICATNDCHYVNKEDANVQQILMCISTSSCITDSTKLHLPTEEFYIKSTEQMAELFPTHPEAIENTVKIAQRCNVTFEFGKTKLPYFHIKGVEDNQLFLRKMCLEGLRKRYENPTKQAYERLEYELSVIIEMGYTDYYLIVWDFINYAKSQKIPVGPGRGSGAGSLCAYCIGITAIDPLKYNLLFERFLNPQRKTMPDFDIDFCMEGRQKVIDYVVRKYGSDHVAQIVTFGTLGAKQAVRDVARTLGLSYKTGDVIAKALPREYTIEYSLKNLPQVKQLYQGDENIRKVIDWAMKIEGMPRNISTHAAGVVITKQPVDHYVPLYARDGTVSTQYTMTILERLGLLKIDFLGLRNLTIINHCCQAVRKIQADFSIEKIPLDDKQVYEMLSLGKTEGVFQFESAGMTSTIVKLKPTGIEDLIAVISLYRPGPMDSIPKYIRNRHNPSLVTYKHPLLEGILKVTYGCIVYQEQVMQIFRTLAGYSYGRADIVRRAMAKKKADVLENERKAFIWGEQGECCGAVANGVDPKTANEIFDEMTSFASYAFNKSHAAAYALVAYQTAYLKCHYYLEYMAALMTNALIESTQKLAGYILDVNKNGVEVLVPDINKSERGFVTESGKIRFALLAVKGLGEGAIASIVKERTAGGEFKSFQDFCLRVHGKDITVRSVESLIKAGAFECFKEYNRRELFMNCALIMDSVSDNSGRILEGQLDFFSIVKDDKEIVEEKIEHYENFKPAQLLELEYDALGMYVTAHPIDSYEIIAAAQRFSSITEILKEWERGSRKFGDGAKVNFVGMLTARKNFTTKKGDIMCFVTLEDRQASVEALVFPKAYEAFNVYLKDRVILRISGKISSKENENPKILVDYVESAEDFYNNAMKKNLFLKVSSKDKGKIDRIRLCAKKYSDISSKNRLWIFFEDIKKTTEIKAYKTIKLSAECIGEFQDICKAENVVLSD